MKDKVINYLDELVDNIPQDWLNLTTHRLDIYDESQAKFQFLDHFNSLFNEQDASQVSLNNLPTAYDYIRLGHPLSCVLEWSIANLHDLPAKNVIAFSSQTIGILSILRKNLLEGKKTLILYVDKLPDSFDSQLLQKVYSYNFEIQQIRSLSEVEDFDGSKILISESASLADLELSQGLDFYISIMPNMGSIIIANGKENEAYIPDIQHVRRRETIALTPIHCLSALKKLAGKAVPEEQNKIEENKKTVQRSIRDISGTNSKVLIGSSGLSIQYAIMMGLIHDATEKYPGKEIKFIVPPNCYGGTNDQARRVATCIDNVEIVDFLVDGDNDMVQSIDQVLERIASEDAIPFIIAEIPTNPRVEVPDLEQLKKVLAKERFTKTKEAAIDPVFILDQTFCPNVHFLGEGKMLSTVRAISYTSGSKFPSGGKCTAGFCVGNAMVNELMEKIEMHLQLCDNEATELQLDILAQQLPSMNKRIKEAYHNTREFVNYIEQVLPTAKINFVSEELSNQGFTPSVFSLDLPTTGSTQEEKEQYKRKLNHQLINMMITEIPKESKYCVSYGQLKGCYWTIPATSTQGTTKEGDKDYIIRAALSPNMNLDLHKSVFTKFVETL